MMRWVVSRLLDGLLRPWGAATAGPGSRMAFPRRLRGRDRISFGQHARVGAFGWIEAVRTYGDQRFDPRIEIGRDVVIGRHVTITATRRVSIGEGSLLSEGVYLSDTAHDVEGFGPLPLSRRPLRFKGEVHLGPRCFLGFRACVMPGVTLGEGCVVGAHAVVTRSFGPGSVVAGVPARLLRKVGDAG